MSDRFLPPEKLTAQYGLLPFVAREVHEMHARVMDGSATPEEAIERVQSVQFDSEPFIGSNEIWFEPEESQVSSHG